MSMSFESRLSSSASVTSDASKSLIDEAQQHATDGRITSRILPLMFGYILGQLNRINIGIAQLQFKGDPGFSDSACGPGAGLLFVGNVLFVIPGDLMLDHIGVREPPQLIMFVQGLPSIVTLFVRTSIQFHIVCAPSSPRSLHHSRHAAFNFVPRYPVHAYRYQHVICTVTGT